jgi:hypothetical protein
MLRGSLRRAADGGNIMTLSMRFCKRYQVGIREGMKKKKKEKEKKKNV